MQKTFTFALLTAFSLAVRLEVVPEMMTTTAETTMEPMAVEEPVVSPVAVAEPTPAPVEEPVAVAAPVEMPVMDTAFEMPDLSNLGFMPTVNEVEAEPAVAQANFDFTLPEMDIAMPIPEITDVPEMPAMPQLPAEPVVTPVAVEEPAPVVEEPVAAPVAVEEPAAVEPVVAPVAAEEPAAVEEPVAADEPTAVEEVAAPEVVEQVAAPAVEAAVEEVVEAAVEQVVEQVSEVAAEVATEVAAEVAEATATEVAAEVADSAEATEEPATEEIATPDLSGVAPTPVAQEEAPEVEAGYYGPGGLSGPVSPFPVEEQSIIPPPVEEECRNCGLYGCDCDELRDRRNYLRDDNYSLREQEREAKQRVRDIRGQMREQRYERRDLGHTLMTRRSEKLRREMDERKEQMSTLGSGDEYNQLRQENKYAKKNLRDNSRRRSQLMARMRGGRGGRGGFDRQAFLRQMYGYRN